MRLSEQQIKAACAGFIADTDISGADNNDGRLTHSIDCTISIGDGYEIYVVGEVEILAHEECNYHSEVPYNQYEYYLEQDGYEINLESITLFNAEGDEVEIENESQLAQKLQSL